MEKLRFLKDLKGLPGLSLTIVFGLLTYIDFSHLGFPDGHLTEYESILKSRLYPAFFAGDLLFLSGFLWFLFRQKKTAGLWWGYLIFLFLFLATTYYYSKVLEHGGGG